MHIPFVDLRAQHDELRAELDAVLREAIDKSSFIGGPFVTAFEQHFAAYCGVEHAVGCASGTDALKLALMATGVCAGDEVITVPNTFIATTEAVTAVGAFPRFVDIDVETYCLSPHKLAEFLETGCRPGRDGHYVNAQNGRPVTAVVPVHLYGLPADMAPILELAEHYHLAIVEDACQAHGAAYTLGGEVKRAGALSTIAAFSFYPGKNLGAMGEAGAVVTGDAEMAGKMRMWRDHGQAQKYVHTSPDGWNGRLDALQAAVLDIKLDKLDEWNERRRQVARWYLECLAGDERVVLPMEPEGRRHVYHLFVVRLRDRERVRQYLTEEGIGVGLHYPIPLHLQDAYRGLEWNTGDFPEAERAAAAILSLPMFPHLTEDQVDCVCGALKRVM